MQLLLIILGAYPFSLVIFALLAPHLSACAGGYAAVCLLLSVCCCLLPGRVRVAAGLAGCTLMAASVLRAPSLSDGIALAAAAVFYGVTLMRSLPVASWPRERTVGINLLFVGCGGYLLAQVMCAAAGDGEMDAARKLLSVCFFFYFLLMMLSLNRGSLAGAGLERYAVPAAVRRRNLVITLAVTALVLLLSVLPGVAALVRQVFVYAAGLVFRLIYAVLSLFPEEGAVGSGPGGGGGFGAVGAPAEPGWLSVLMEMVFAAVAVIGVTVVIVYALVVLGRRLKELAANLIQRWKRFSAAASEDYIDEVSDIREEDGERSSLLSRIRLSRMHLQDDPSLAPERRIRRRYMKVRLRSKGWTSSQTVRDQLSGESAPLYERARYGEKAMTGEEAERFIRLTK